MTVQIHPEVNEALRGGAPVVALESALVTAVLSDDLSLETARRLDRIVRDGGAVPATVGVIGGTLHVGVDGEGLARLAHEGRGVKASVRDLASTMATGRTAGTTVSATLHACGLAGRGALRVLATGGIGGVHRSWTRLPDVSADLRQLAVTPACVVSSGAKSLLDAAATLELLETLGVPVLAWRTDEMPQFYCRASGLAAPHRVDELDEAAAICRTHWETLGGAGVLLANPVPASVGLDVAEVTRIVETADVAAGTRRTPDLLRVIAERTGGRAVEANLALLAENAALAARLAAAL